MPRLPPHVLLRNEEHVVQSLVPEIKFAPTNPHVLEVVKVLYEDLLDQVEISEQQGFSTGRCTVESDHPLVFVPGRRKFGILTFVFI